MDFEITVPIKNVSKYNSQIEALILIGNTLGRYSLEYGRDFQFKTCNTWDIVLNFTKDQTQLLQHLKWID